MRHSKQIIGFAKILHLHADFLGTFEEEQCVAKLIQSALFQNEASSKWLDMFFWTVIISCHSSESKRTQTSSILKS